MGKGKRINLKNATLKEILGFSLLPFGLLACSSVVNSVLNMYMTDILGLSAGLTLVVLFGSKIWDAFNDPMMGFIVEKTNTRFGKCRPYILIGVIPLILTCVLMFVPIKSSEIGNFFYIFIMYLLFYTAYTAVYIPYQALAPLAFPENDKRVKAVSWSNLIGSMGTILPTILLWPIVDLVGKKYGFMVAALVMSVLACLILIASFFMIKEKVVIPKQDVKIKECIKLVGKDKNIVILLIAALLAGGYAAAGVFLPYFTKYNCIGILPMEELNSFLNNILGFLNLAEPIKLSELSVLTPLLSIGSGLAYMISMALVPIFLKRMTKKQLWILTAIIGLVSNLLLYVFGMFVPGLQYNTLGGMIFHILFRFFSQFPAGVTLVLSITMLADHVDQKEMETGKRLEGTIYSVKCLFTKIAVAVFVALPMILLEVVNYDGAKMDLASESATAPLISSPLVTTIVDGQNYTEILNMIFVGMTLLFVLVSVIMIVPMLFYKVDEKKLQADVEQYRADKKQAEIDRIERIYQETLAQQAGNADETTAEIDPVDAESDTDNADTQGDVSADTIVAVEADNSNNDSEQVVADEAPVSDTENDSEATDTTVADTAEDQASSDDDQKAE